LEDYTLEFTITKYLMKLGIKENTFCKIELLDPPNKFKHILKTLSQ